MQLPCRFFEVNIVVGCRGRNVAFDGGQSFVMIDGVHSVKRDASGNVNSEAKRRRQTRKKGCLNEMFAGVCGEIEFGELSKSQKERLLSKVCEMVEVKREEGRFLVMKYQVTQALWESVTGSNPSYFKGAS